MKRCWIFLTGFLFILGSVHAQDGVRAFLSVSNNTPYLGESFEVILTIESPEPISILDIDGLETDDQIEVLAVSDVVGKQVDSGWQYLQVTKVILWEAGVYITPELFVMYQSLQGDNTLPISSISVTVLQAIADPLNTSRQPNADTITIPFIARWMIILGGITTFVTVVFVARIIGRIIKPIAGIGEQSPKTETIMALEDLMAQSIEPDMLFALVADILRRYLAKSLSLNAIEMTTSEIDNALAQQELLSSNDRKQLRQIFDQADLIKFAQLQPDASASTRYVKFAIKWLKEVEVPSDHND